MKDILNISLILFNIIIFILITLNINKNSKEYFNDFMNLGEHFQIKCKPEKDEVIICNKTNCSDDIFDNADKNFQKCLLEINEINNIN